MPQSRPVGIPELTESISLRMNPTFARLLVRQPSPMPLLRLFVRSALLLLSGFAWMLRTHLINKEWVHWKPSDALLVGRRCRRILALLATHPLLYGMGSNLQAQVVSVQQLLDVQVEAYRVDPEVWGELYQRITGVSSIQLTESSPGSDPVLAILWEFPGRRTAALAITQTEWDVVLMGGLPPLLERMPRPSSETDFDGADDPTNYRIVTTYAGKDPEGKGVFAMLVQNDAFEQYVVLARTDLASTVIRRGDKVPRSEEPDPILVGGEFTEFRSPVLHGAHVVFAGSGRNFTGVYTRPIDGGELSVLAESFLPIGNRYGTIHSTDVGEDGTIYFTSNKGIYSTRTEGADPQLIASVGSEYAPGKGWSNPTTLEVDGDQMVFGAYDAGQRPSVFWIQNLSSSPAEVSVSYIAGGETPIPGGLGNFAATQLPILSGNSVVFEGYGRTGYLGVFGSGADGIVFPILKRGDLLDGKSVSLGGYQNGSLLGHTLGLAVQFQDFTSAPYLVTLRGGEPEIEFIRGIAAFSPQLGFRASFTGKVGKTYQLEFAENAPLESSSDPTWIPLGTSTVEETGIGVLNDPAAINKPSRLYRVTSDR